METGVLKSVEHALILWSWEVRTTTDTVDQYLWASASSSFLLMPTAQKVGHLLSGSKQMEIAVEETKRRGHLTAITDLMGFNNSTVLLLPLRQSHSIAHSGLELKAILLSQPTSMLGLQACIKPG